MVKYMVRKSLLILAMKKQFLIVLVASLSFVSAWAQVSDAELTILKKLDSARNNSSVAKYFADLYFNTTVRAISFFSHREAQQKNLIVRFETRFADYFFKAAEAYHRHDTVPGEWETYFADSTFSPLQYKLFGINAHINGDIWKALTAEFSNEELKKMKKSYVWFQHSLIRQFMEFFRESYQSSARIRQLHFITAGLEKEYGKMLLKSWRRRQYRLAFLFYSAQKQFAVKLNRLNRKMNHINHLILHIL